METDIPWKYMEFEFGIKDFKHNLQLQIELLSDVHFVRTPMEDKVPKLNGCSLFKWERHTETSTEFRKLICHYRLLYPSYGISACLSCDVYLQQLGSPSQ